MCLKCVKDGKTERHHGPKPKPEQVFSPLLESSNTEHAWAAGFFDGEGWTSQIKGGVGYTRRYVQIGVSQKDSRPLTRFLEAVEDGYITNKTRPVGQWRANGQYAYRVMEKLWPFLSDPKREQFLAVLGKQAALARAREEAAV